MSQYPKISIITPSYNQGQYIEDTIISVLGQGYPNLEYIVIDGGSTDHTVDILNKYDSQIAYWESVKDNGQAHAINKGFTRATGDILMWLNSDDMLLAGTLFYIAEQVSKQGEGIYFGNCIHFKEAENLWTQGSDVIASNNLLDIRAIDYIIQPSSWWTRNVWESTGLLREDIHYVFDWQWFIRAHKQYPFYPQNKAISLYRFHEDHKSGTGGERRNREILSILTENAPREAKLFEMLLQEDDLIKMSVFKRLKIKFVSIQCRLKGEKISYERVLKLAKPNKYKEYTLDEMIRYKNC